MRAKTLGKALLAISPIIVMLTIYLAGSVIAGDFYKIPISVAFLVASVYAILITRGASLDLRIETFSQGAANPRLLLMTWIFILAGAFAALAKAMGAVDATVAFTLHFVPENFLPVGIFLAACFISVAVGTSVGTIVALTPIATTLSAQIGYDTAWLVAVVVGGAFFGDNLSFISDTTIAATQTQGCSMRDKFRTNFLLVLPAALATIAIYLFMGIETGVTGNNDLIPGDIIKMLPYLLVIVTALAGVNVLVVLTIGIIATGIIGVCTQSFDIVSAFTAAGGGISSMGDLIIVTLLAGGLLEMLNKGGGMGYIIRLVTYRIRSKRSAEFSIILLTALSNLCTANNTIAILSTGEIASKISKEFGIAPRRVASLMDTTSCFVQGIIPYGAQILIAAGLAHITPVAIIPNLYYPAFIGAMVVVSILLQLPKCNK